MKVGVVGVGAMGRHHPRVYYELPGVELVGVADVDEEKADSIAEKYDCKAFYSPKKLLEKGVDAVSIAVPTTKHADIANLFLREGVDVLVEKPIATTIKEAESMTDNARENNCVLAVGHIERYNPIVGEVKKLLNFNGDNRIFRIETRRKGPTTRITDTGVVLDLLVHDIDVARYLLGEEPEITHVEGGKVKTDHVDWCQAVLNYGGVPVSHETDRLTQKKIRKLEITSEDMYIDMDYMSQEMEISREAKAITSHNDSISISEETQKVNGRGEPLKAELEDFVKSVKRGKTPMISGEEGKRNLKIALDILEMIE